MYSWELNVFMGEGSRVLETGEYIYIYIYIEREREREYFESSAFSSEHVLGCTLSNR